MPITIDLETELKQLEERKQKDNPNLKYLKTLQWRHNERHCVSNHRHFDCLSNRLFRRRSKKTPKLHVTGLCEGNTPRLPVNSPHKGPVTRKMSPFDDVTIMLYTKADCLMNKRHGLIDRIVSEKNKHHNLTVTNLNPTKQNITTTHQEPLLLTWFKFNPNMDKWSHAQ